MSKKFIIHNRDEYAEAKLMYRNDLQKYIHLGHASPSTLLIYKENEYKKRLTNHDNNDLHNIFKSYFLKLNVCFHFIV